MTAEDRMKTELFLDEGYSPDPRFCAGRLTTGVGRDLDGNPLTAAEVAVVGHDGRNKTISRGAAAYLLENDIKNIVRRLDAATSRWKTLDEVRRRALVNMTLAGLPEIEALLATVEAGDWEAASRTVLDSAWAQQAAHRARKVAHMLRHGMTQEILE